MKKNDLLSDEIWAFQPFESAAGEGALQSDRTHDVEFGDDGDPYQLALNAASVSSGEVYTAKLVASIATLANYLVNGFWQYNNTVAHLWPSNTITFNTTGLNSAEQLLAPNGAAGMVRSCQCQLRPDLRLREHHIHPRWHDAGL